MLSRHPSHRITLGILIFFAVAYGFAQTTGGRMFGRVTDPTGASIPGATVTVTNEATGVARTGTSDSNGDFTLPDVPVGTYTIAVTREGFKQNVRKGVVLELNQVLTLNTVLQVGSKEEIVNVTGEAPLVDTSSTQLGSVMNDKAVQQLPLNTRDTYQLLQLQPGVQGVGGSDLFYGSNTPGGVSVNGGRSRSNNFTVNGGDGNDLFVNAPAIQPSPDSIQEFRVLANTFDAEYGRNSGAVINVVTKSGTNNWHGSLYEFLRNTHLDAKPYLAPAVPDDHQNEFGGTFGGPIAKDRTFFFTSYEGRRVVLGQVGDPVVVPSAAERAGDFSAGPAFAGTLTDNAVAQMLAQRCGTAIVAAGGAAPAPNTPWASIFPGNKIPTSCFDPAAAALMQLYVPQANAPGSIFQSIPDELSHDNQFTVRVDHRINDKQNFTGYYYFDDIFDGQPFTRFEAETPNLLPGFGNNNKTRSQQINLSHDWTINSTLVNEVRLTYFREAQGTFLHPQRTMATTASCNGTPAAPFCFTGTADTSVITPNPNLGILPGGLGPNHTGVPFIDISGGFTIGNDFEGELPQIGNTYQASDNLTKVVGNHTMKFGVDYRNQRFLQTLFFDPNGDYTFSGGGLNDFVFSDLFPNYLMGLPDSYLQGSTQTEDVRGNAVYLFAQDSWKIRPNLTMNYGLRWEYNQPIYDAGGRYQTYRPGQATTTYPCQIATTDPVNPNFGSPTAQPVSCQPGTPFEEYFPLGLVVPGDKGVPKGLTDSYYKAFAPRFGLAWDPWNDGKWTIRGGYGIFYNPIEQLVLEQFQGEPPFGGSSLVSEGFFDTPFVFQSCNTLTPTIPCSVNNGAAPNPFTGILDPAHNTAVDWPRFRPILLFGELQPHMKPQYTEQYNFGIQHQLSESMVMSIGYVGSQGHHLLATHDINFGNPQTCLDIIAALGPSACGPFFEDSQIIIPAGTFLPQGLHLPYGSVSFIPAGTTTTNPIDLVGLRPFSSPFCQPTTGVGCPADGVPVFSSIFAQDTIANSAYNSLQASLEKRFSHGLQFEAAYTFSKSIDEASSFENILIPTCNSCNRALSLFDARNRFVFSYLWNLPVPNYQGFKGKALNGWAVSGITTFQSGFPIRLGSQADQELMNSFDFELPGKPDIISPFQIGDPRKSGFCAIGTGPGTGSPCQGGNYYFNPNGFALPALTPQSTPAQLLGDAGRTICCGPGIDNFDFALHKTTPVTESTSIEFRTEFFNIFNHTQFLNPDGTITDGADFGKVKRTRDPREIQFALKFLF
jgi:hypothetical protein